MGTILHVHNVQRPGGTGNFAYDLARCFPDHHHVALCVNDARGDQQWRSDVSPHLRPMYAPQLTPSILSELRPSVVILHATGAKSLAGPYPWGWLSAPGRRVVSWHHVALSPIIPADLDVFESQYVEAHYAPFMGQVKRGKVIPPCTDLGPYAAISREGPIGSRVTTAGKGCPASRGLASLVPGWEWDHKPPGRLGALAGYLAGFDVALIWSGHQETWCRTVSESMAAGCVTIAHRAGAIPEQIVHGVHGFLFDDQEEAALILRQLRGLPEADASGIREAGRARALEIAGFDRLRRELGPFLEETS